MGDRSRVFGRPLASLAVLAAATIAGALAYSIHIALGLHHMLHPRRAEVRALGRSPGLRAFRGVSFEAADGTRLSGWWASSSNGAAVVLVHGWAASREQMLPQAQMLRAQGFGVLVFDLRAHGESDGGLCTLGDRERFDVEGAVGFVEGEPDVEPGRIGTVGFSLGALAVAMEAIGDPRVRAIVFEAGHPSLEDLVRRNFGSRGLLSQLPAVAAARVFGLRLDETRPVDRLCELRPRPVLLIYGERDEVAPPAIGPVMLAASCGTGRLWIVAGGAHGDWDNASPPELEARLTGFFEEALRPARRGPAAPAGEGGQLER